MTRFLLWVRTYCISCVVQQTSGVKDLSSLVRYDDSCCNKACSKYHTCSMTTPKYMLPQRLVIYLESNAVILYKFWRPQPTLPCLGLQSGLQYSFTKKTSAVVSLSSPSLRFVNSHGGSRIATASFYCFCTSLQPLHIPDYNIQKFSVQKCLLLNRALYCSLCTQILKNLKISRHC